MLSFLGIVLGVLRLVGGGTLLVGGASALAAVLIRVFLFGKARLGSAAGAMLIAACVACAVVRINAGEPT